MNMKHLYTSLGSGVTSGSVTDNSITDDSVIEIYFDNTDCYIDTTSQSGHTVYFTVGGNATGTNVCVVVNNLTNFTPYDDTNVTQRVSTLETDVETLDNLVTTLETDVETLETRVDGLNASNINYDEHSTLYSAMGDIDELETTSKNLVGAINELKESGGGSQEIYTNTEKLVGKWFNRNLYMKSFEYTGGLSGSANKAHNTTFDTIIKFEGIGYQADGGFTPIPSVHYSSIQNMIGVFITHSEFLFRFGSNTSINKITCTIYYTKVGE